MKSRRYATAVFAFLCIYVLFDAFCIAAFKVPFNPDFHGIIAGTNFEESSEFISTFLTPKPIILWLATIAATAATYFICKHTIKAIPTKPAYAMLCCVPICIILQLTLPASVAECNIFYNLKLFITYQRTPDLRAHIKHERLSLTGKQPENIVIIIGESHTKSHSSLYGYEKLTNPNLQAISDTATLILFNNTHSPNITTVECFKEIMSTHRQGNDKTPFYECPNFIQIASDAGYSTIWLSNQSKKGLWDNLIAKYAELCDTNIFIGNKFAGCDRKSFDGDLLPELDMLTTTDNTSKEKRLYILHLIGSHEEFNQRYPAEFNHFKAEDYTYPESTPAKRMMAFYDNSLLYNDFVTSSIIQRFTDKEAVVIYFPDHGMDMYESSDDFFGHGIKSNRRSFEAASSIPFIIYPTSKYRTRFATMVSKMGASANNDFCTCDFIYFLMDVMGVEFAEDNSVKNHSPLSQSTVIASPGPKFSATNQKQY